MIARVALVTALVAGCGRVGFDLAAGTPGADGGRAADGAITGASGCTAIATAPTMLTIQGRTLNYTDFANDFNPVPNGTVTANVNGNAGSFSTTSNGSGNYTLHISTGGMPVQVDLDARQAMYLTSHVHFTSKLAADLQLDINLFSEGSLASTYGTGSATYRDTLGTVIVVGQDCSGALAGNVAVNLSPAPSSVVYTGDGAGMAFAFGRTQTELPYAQAVGFGAQPGANTVAASSAGGSGAATFTVIANDVDYVYAPLHP